MDEDDLVLLSELIKWTPNLVENNADCLEKSKTGEVWLLLKILKICVGWW